MRNTILFLLLVLLSGCVSHKSEEAPSQADGVSFAQAYYNVDCIVYGRFVPSKYTTTVTRYAGTPSEYVRRYAEGSIAIKTPIYLENYIAHNGVAINIPCTNRLDHRFPNDPTGHGGFPARVDVLVDVRNQPPSDGDFVWALTMSATTGRHLAEYWSSSSKYPDVRKIVEGIEESQRKSKTPNKPLQATPQ